jgi:hypothetical protein
MAAKVMGVTTDLRAGKRFNYRRPAGHLVGQMTPIPNKRKISVVPIRPNTLSILACLLAGGLLAPPAGAQTLAGDPADQIIGADFTPLALDIGGRVVETSFAKTVGDTQFGGPAYEHQWPGVYFAAAFHGSEVDFKLEDAANHYDVLVDHAITHKSGGLTGRGLDTARRT